MKGGPLLSLLEAYCPHCTHARHVPGCCKAMRFVIDYQRSGKGGAWRCECEVETDGAGECGVEGHAAFQTAGDWGTATPPCEPLAAVLDTPRIAGLKPGHSPAAFAPATIEEVIRGAQERDARADGGVD